MTLVKTVPVTISPEAAQHVAELGRQREFEQMLEHARQAVPDLLSLEVELVEPPDDPAPRVVVLIWMKDPHTDSDSLEWELSAWRVATFSPEVNQHFFMMILFKEPDER